MSLLQLLLMASLAFTATASCAAPSDRVDAVGEFVDEMVAEHGFDRSELMRLLGQTRFRHDIIRAMERPAEAKPWHQYRPIFVTMARTRAGALFERGLGCSSSFSS